MSQPRKIVFYASSYKMNLIFDIFLTKIIEVPSEK